MAPQTEQIQAESSSNNETDSPASRFRKNRMEPSMLNKEALNSNSFDITSYKNEVTHMNPHATPEMEIERWECDVLRCMAWER